MKSISKIYFSLLLLGCLTFLYSCSDKEAEGIPSEPSGVISLSAGSDSDFGISRSSIGSFPNNGRIGITAAYYNSNPDSINWKSYADIFDTGATAVLSSGNSYTFTWDSPKYWPFDNKQLVFLAYSPPVSETNNGFLLDVEAKAVLLRLYDGMPDFMYATANVTSISNPYSKTPLQTVNLGEFQHALSKLTVEVVGDPSMNPDIRLSNLSVKTNKRSTSFDLTSGMLHDPVSENNFIYNLVSSSTQFSSVDTIRKNVFLFPGTEEVTEISVGLTDNSVFVSHDFMMSFFQNVTNVGHPLLLKRGKNTTLRIKVKGTNVTNVEIDLKGVLSDWNQQGNFGIVIN